MFCRLDPSIGFLAGAKINIISDIPNLCEYLFDHFIKKIMIIFGINKYVDIK